MSSKELTLDPLHKMLDYCSNRDTLSLGCASAFFKDVVNSRKLWLRRANAIGLNFLPEDPKDAKLYYLAICSIKNGYYNSSAQQLEALYKYKSEQSSLYFIIRHHINFWNGGGFHPTSRNDFKQIEERAEQLAKDFKDNRGLLLLAEYFSNPMLSYTFLEISPENLKEISLDSVQKALYYSGSKVSKEALSEKIIHHSIRGNNLSVSDALANELLSSIFQRYSFEELKKGAHALYNLTKNGHKVREALNLVFQSFNLEQVTQLSEKRVLNYIHHSRSHEVLTEVPYEKLIQLKPKEARKLFSNGIEKENSISLQI